jgi:hypothetical protein
MRHCQGTNRKGESCERIPEAGEHLCRAHRKSELDDHIQWARNILQGMAKVDDDLLAAVCVFSMDIPSVRRKVLATLETRYAPDPSEPPQPAPSQMTEPADPPSQMTEGVKTASPEPADEGIEFIEEEPE